ncbi:MAG: NADPH-dependent FMN reductase [Ferruginibacter sp.]
MAKISIISASVRTGRNSHRVALYFDSYINDHKIATTEILDLMEYNFPLFEERLKFQKDPSPKTLEFAEKIKASDSIIIVTPEYNGGYPASLKNVIDLLQEEWLHKPIGIATVSAGPFAGTQCITSLQFSLWKMKAWTITEHYAVAKVQDAYDEAGKAIDKEATDKRAAVFVKELIRCIEMKK